MTTSKKTIAKAADAIDLGQVLKTAARSSLESALGQNSTGKGANLADGALEAATGARSRGSVAKPALIAAVGVAGVTAASAALSAVRRSQGS